VALFFWAFWNYKQATIRIKIKITAGEEKTS